MTFGAELDNPSQSVWLTKALSYLGEREVPGTVHNSKILEWWAKIHAPFNNDETPWCAGFVGGVLEECEILSTRSAAARSYLDWGTKLTGPYVGAVVVFWRENRNGPMGHVGFVVGRDKLGNIMVLGGNQGDAVTIKPFPQYRVLGYRWPKSVVPPMMTGMLFLPKIESDGKLSTNEG